MSFWNMKKMFLIKRYQEYDTSWHDSQYPFLQSKRVVLYLCVCERETPQEWQREKEKNDGESMRKIKEGEREGKRDSEKERA